MELTQAQKNTKELIIEDEGAENVRFDDELNSNGHLKFEFISEDRLGDTYFIWPNGDVIS